MTNTASAPIRVRYAGDCDDVIGTVVRHENFHPDGFPLAEPMVWVQWPDMDGLDLLSWDDVITVSS